MTCRHTRLTVLLATGALCAALVGAAGCAPEASSKPAEAVPSEQPAGNDAEDAAVTSAMVVVLGDGSVLFVDTDSESPYYPTRLEDAEILDADGNATSPEDLASGNVVRVTGNGIMLQSYPGQYPGIAKVEVTSVGSPADAEKYKGLTDQLWSPRDPSQPPAATLEYRTELSTVGMQLYKEVWSWSWLHEDSGERNYSTQTDAVDITGYGLDDLPDARISEPVEATLSFDVPVTAVSVARHPEDGSTVTDMALTVTGGKASFEMEPDSRYEVHAEFEDGEVTYYFVTRAPGA